MHEQHVVLYIRDLPGGGYVAIEGRPVGEGAPYRCALAVERRSDPDRREGHAPPIVLEADGATQSEVFDRLIVVANSNVAVATALLKWQAARGIAPEA